MRKLIKDILRAFGLAVHRIPVNASERIGGYLYAPIHPAATYAPWLANGKFMETFGKVQNNSLVDIYRMHEFWELVGESGKIGGDIVEVGVWRGGTGCLMASRAGSQNSHDKVYLCDTFLGVVKAGERDSHYADGAHDDASSRVVMNLANSLDLNNVRILEGVFPEQTGDRLESVRIRLLHIDVDVYQSCKDIIEFLWSRIPRGGIIVFDDYGFRGCDGVTRYVEELRSEHGLVMIHNLNGHAVFVKISE